MLDAGYKTVCQGIPEEQRYVHSIHWFDNMTTYMSALTKIRDTVISELQTSVDDNILQSKKVFVTSLLMLILISSVSLAVLRVVLFMTKKVQYIPTKRDNI